MLFAVILRYMTHIFEGNGLGSLALKSWPFVRLKSLITNPVCCCLLSFTLNLLFAPGAALSVIYIRFFTLFVSFHDNPAFLFDGHEMGFNCVIFVSI